jgi:enoyl-CoA hydratase
MTSSSIGAALRAQPGFSAHDAANLIDLRSPTARSVALEAVRRAAKLDSIEGVLRQEYRASCSTLRTQDHIEGIRAQVVHKDRNPKWSPASLAAATPTPLRRFFGPVDDDLVWDLPF